MNSRTAKRILTAAVALVMLACMSLPALAYNETVATNNPKGHYKVIWGFDEPEYTVGMKLGDKTSDTKKFLTDNSIGENGYDMVVTEGGGESGKCGKITVHAVPNDFRYVNPIMDLTKYPGKEKVNDWTGYEEMWCWVDIRGFGNQSHVEESTGKTIEGLDFSFQFYEQDWKDGKKVAGKFERYAITEGASYFVQDGSGWKELKAPSSMILRLPKDYKGWVRLPFSSIDIVALLGIGNMTMDLKYVVNFTLGIPMTEDTVGKSMIIDSFVLYSSKDAPAEGSTGDSSTPDSGSEPDTDSSTPVSGSDTESSGSSENSENPGGSSDTESSGDAPNSGSPSGQPSDNGGGATVYWIIGGVALALIAAAAVLLILKKKGVFAKK